MFWSTRTTVESLYGSDFQAWSLFGPLHLFWLGLTILLTWLIFRYYPKFNTNTKKRILIGMTLLMIGDELFKDIPNLLTGQWEWECLPFHLCSVNIFIAILHTWKEKPYMKAILTCICIPAAACALVMPNWVSLPFWNFMHLHSQTVHILLFLYPMTILADGYRPKKNDIPILAGYLIILALLDKGLNAFLGTNFLFLTHNENNPALIFLQDLTGPFYNAAIVGSLFLICTGLLFCLSRWKTKQS